MRRLLSACSGLAVLVLISAAPGWAQLPQTSPQKMLLDEAPAPYVLSPESEGITGPFDSAKARQFGLDTDAFESTEGGEWDAYIRLWVHPRTGDLLVAFAVRSETEDSAAYALRGAVDGLRTKSDDTFEVSGIPDGYGFSREMSQNNEQLVTHTVAFRRGLYTFVYAAVGGPGAKPHVVERFAKEQFDRAPEGRTGVRTSAEISYAAASAFLQVLTIAAIVGGIIFAVRRARRPTPNPPPPYDNP